MPVYTPVPVYMPPEVTATGAPHTAAELVTQGAPTVTQGKPPDVHARRAPYVAGGRAYGRDA